AAPLAASIPALSPELQPWAVAAIGRAGGARAVTELVRMLASPDLATHAAHALARVPGGEARNALERALAERTKGPERRLVVRAAIVRALLLSDPPRGLRDRLEAMFAAKSADVPGADRAVAVFGLVATGAWSTERALDRTCAKEAPQSG